MRRAWWRAVYAAAAAVVAAVVQFLAGLVGGSPSAFVAAALLPPLCYWLWTLSESESRSGSDLFMPGAAAVAGVSLGCFGGAALYGEQGPGVAACAVAVVVSASVAGAIVLVKTRGRSRRCVICERRYPEGGYEFCPRCRRTVCLRSRCWNAESLRCSDCESVGRTLFPADEGWWDENFGERIMRGRCRMCKRDAAACDLRGCGQCAWVLCARCWDLENCRCVNCEWAAPGAEEFLYERRSGLTPRGRAEAAESL